MKTCATAAPKKPIMNLITKLLNIATAFLITLTGRDTYIEGVIGQPEKFDPLQVSTNPIDKSITKLVFSGLTKTNSEEVTPDLAKGWEISENKKTYTLALDAEKKFHDGKPITAKDVIHTASMSAQLRNIDITIETENKIKINLETPFAPLLKTLSLGIVPKHRFNKQNPLEPVGSGSYQIANVERGTKKTDEITLKKFRRDAPGPTKIIFKFFENAESLLTAAELGDIDGFSYHGTAPECFSNVNVPLQGRYFALLFNLKGKELLKDDALRRNLAYLVNREKIIQEAAEGNGVPAYAPLETTWASTELDIPKYDPAQAKEFSGEINFVYPQAEKYKKMANIIKEDWEKTGLEIQLNPKTAAEIKEEILPQRDFDVIIIGQEVGNDPDQYNLWHSTQTENGNNFSGFENMRADQALEEGRTTHGQEARKEHYVNFQTVFAEQLPAIFIYRPTYTYHTKKTEGELNLEGIFKPDERWERILNLSE